MFDIFTKCVWQLCICQPNELKWEIKKKIRGLNGGPSKNLGGLAKTWGAMAHPGPP